MSNINKEILENLFFLQDVDYKNFQAKLTPTLDSELIIGVRTPEMRKLAKKYASHESISEFLGAFPHHYYEEYNLHGFIIQEIKDFDKCVEEINRFLPYVNNWATCDLLRPKVFGKNKAGLLPHIYKWLDSDLTYTVRFGIEMLMCFYLDDDFNLEYPERISKIRSEEYYVNMMIAWYFATALAKQYDAVLPYLTENKLDTWTNNKTIQKAIESYRITNEQKTYLRGLKRPSVSR